jgi:hypothetical protein
VNDAVIALLAAVFGGAGLKFVEALIGRGKVKFDVATQIREELRSEINQLREELRKEIEARRKVEAEVVVWKDKYYVVIERLTAVQLQLSNAEDSKWEPPPPPTRKQ